MAYTDTKPRELLLGQYINRYLARELESKKWSLLVLIFSPSVFIWKECAEISYFDLDLKNNTMVL
jgi:hypothetical protein